MENKKQLKDFINKNGFFFHVVDVNQLKGSEINSFLGVEKNGIKTSVERPEENDNIMFFRGVATQQFSAGESNRNGYKIDVKAWDWTNYLKNPQILLSHDETQPIGKCLEIIPYNDRIEILYYVDLNSMNAQDAHRCRTNLYAGLSTGSLTIEVMWEDAVTGERFTEEQLMQMPYKELMDRQFVRAVTKAECIEISKVSLPSNPDALTMEDGIKKYFDQLEDRIKLFDENRVPLAKNETDDEEEEKKVDEPPAKPAEEPESEGQEGDQNGGEGEGDEDLDEEENDANGDEDDENDGQEGEAGDGNDSGDAPEGADSEESPETAGATPAAGEPAAENAEGKAEGDDEDEGQEGGSNQQPGNAADEGGGQQPQTPNAEPNRANNGIEQEKAKELDLNAALEAAPTVLKNFVKELSEQLLTAKQQLDSIPQRKGRLLTDQFRGLKPGEEDKISTPRQTRTNGAWARGLARQVGTLR